MLGDHSAAQTSVGLGFHAFPVNSISRYKTWAHGIEPVSISWKEKFSVSSQLISIHCSNVFT